MRTLKHQRGFSLVEMMVVVLILLIVAGIAIPKTMEAIYDVRLRNAGSELAGLMQQARSMAIRDNTYYPVKWTTSGGSLIFFVDTSPVSGTPNRNTNSTYKSSFPTVQFGGGITKTTTNPDASGTSQPWAFTPLALTSKPYWGSLGLPCGISAGKCMTTVSGGGATSIAGYQIFLTDNRPFGTKGFVSVTASPGGRVRVWTWSGSAWK